MKFNFSFIIILSCLTLTMFSYPKLSQENINIQKELVKKINLEPNNVELRFELAMELAATGWVELAWEQLALVPKLHPSYKDVVYEKYSKKIIEDPENWKYHFRIAFAYYFLNKKEASINSFKRVLEIYPKHVWSMGYIALIHGEQKNYKKCISWCIKALKINDNATPIHFLLGKAHYETGNIFGVAGEALSVARLKSFENKYRPKPPIGINK